MLSSRAKIVAWLAASTVIAGAASRAPAQQDVDETPGLAQTEISRYGGIGEMMDRYGLRLTGFVQGGWTYNFQRPDNGSNGWGFLFNDKSEDPTLNQIDLKLERAIPYSPDRFNMGFTAEVIFGSDARFTQANGTNFYGSGYANRRQLTFFPVPPPFDNVVSAVGFPGQGDPNNQIDFLQANVTMNLPYGNGIMLTGGKMVTPFGYEKINATETPFYSHSYIFSLSQPRTLTGITASYQFDDNWSAMGGIVVGWDQAFEDNNSAPSYMLQGTYVSEENWDVQVTTLFGPEQPDDDGNWRWLVDATAHWHWSVYDFGIEGVVGYESDISTPREEVPLTGGGSAPFQVFEGDGAWWYGAALYGGLYLDSEKRFYIQARGEFFGDVDGARLLSGEVWEGTIGMQIVPWVNNEVGKNLMFRPEIRYDYSNDALFDDNQKDAQITFAIDAIFKY